MQKLFKIKSFSPSMIGTYLDCPKLFYYRYIAKIQLPTKKAPLLLGSAFHEVIQYVLEGGKEPDRIFKEKLDINQLTEEEKEEYPKLVEQGNFMIKTFLDNQDRLDKQFGINHKQCEKWLDIELVNPMNGEKLPINMHGKIDLITKENKIVEWKSASKPWNPKDIGFKLQTILYSWAEYQLNQKHPPEIIYAIFLKSAKVGQENPQILRCNYSIADYGAMFEQIKGILLKIENNIYDKPEKFHASYCDCYKYEELLKV